MHSIPAESINPLILPKLTSFSLVGTMVQDMEVRRLREEYKIFLEENTREQQQQFYLQKKKRFHQWLEAAVKLRDIDVVSRLVKFVRESDTEQEVGAEEENSIHLGAPKPQPWRVRSLGLRSYHFHCLLRAFAMHADYKSLEQLIILMEERDLETKNTANKAQNVSYLLNGNTVAWLMWTAFKADHISRIVDIFSYASLKAYTFSGKENASVMLFPPPDTYNEEPKNSRICPSISMLLYIVAQYSAPMAGMVSRLRSEKTAHRSKAFAEFSCQFPPELSVVLAATLKLLDVSLQAMDYISLLISVLNNYTIFPRIQQTVLYNGKRSFELPREGYSSFRYLTERFRNTFTSACEKVDRGTTSHLLQSVMTALEHYFYQSSRSIDEVSSIGFVQCRHLTLEGWVRTTLDCACRDLSDPSPVFDAVLTWGDIQQRHLFVFETASNLLNKLPKRSTDYEKPPSTMKEALHRLREIIREEIEPWGASKSCAFFPMFTSIALLADNMSVFPWSCIRHYMQTCFQSLLTVALQNPVYSRSTKHYIRSQQLLFASSSTLQPLLKELLGSETFEEGGQRIAVSIVRETVRCALDVCIRWVPQNLKLNPSSLEERYKWWIFNDCRDIALTLYGSVPDINERVRLMSGRRGFPGACKDVRDDGQRV